MMNYRLSLEYTVHVIVYHAVFSGLLKVRHENCTKNVTCYLYRNVISFHTSTLFIQMQCTFKSLRSFFYLDEYILISINIDFL